jgi:soluble lytic murein transglycosylase-like protein
MLLSAVARQESGYDATAVSHAGAQGLMQLMPATAQGLGVADPFNPAQAIDGAARLLKDLTTRFGSTQLALAAYNAGPGAVLKYDGVPPYTETQNYVRSIMKTLEATT